MDAARIGGGFLVSILLFFTLTPFDNMVLQASYDNPGNIALEMFALIYDYFHVGLLFAVLGMTLYEVFKGMEN